MLFDLCDEIENLLKRKYKENVHSQNDRKEYDKQNILFSYNLNGNIDIFLNINEKQVAIRLFCSDDNDVTTECLAINVLHNNIENINEFVYDDIFNKDITTTQVVFRYKREIELFSNFNKVLDFAEHLADNIYI